MTSYERLCVIWWKMNLYVHYGHDVFILKYLGVSLLSFHSKNGKKKLRGKSSLWMYLSETWDLD